MKALIVGKGGQLAWELQRTAPQGYEVIELGREQLDITQADATQDALAQYRPDLVINAAAYTAVDKAESEPELAFAVNEQGARNLAQACRDTNARLLHVSTDFVFDGTQATPYLPTDAANPAGVYGASKLAGEKAIAEIVPETSVIVRTAWVYSAHGHNFVKTMLRLMTDKPQLGVVYDQVGTPTWARNLAVWLWSVAPDKAITGCYHWTDAGVASWYDFAVAIQELALAKGLLEQAIPIRPLATHEYPVPAPRPAYSVMSKASAEKASNLQTLHWRGQLSRMLDELNTYE